MVPDQTALVVTSPEMKLVAAEARAAGSAKAAKDTNNRLERNMAGGWQILAGFTSRPAMGGCDGKWVR